MHSEHYQRLVEDRMREVVQKFTERSDASQLSNFWQMNESVGFRKPMTSLRDVDAGGVILGATRDPYRARGVHLETVRHVMRVIRGQRVPARSDMDADPAPMTRRISEMADQSNNRIVAGGRGPARLYPPRMTRSQPQLATSYAPGSMFTWEGGKGACMAVPVEGATLDFSARPTRRAQIIENLEEACESWLARGMTIKRDPRVYEVQLLDNCFYNTVRKHVEIALDKFEFMRPDRVGYLPGPLVYRCDSCERCASIFHQRINSRSPAMACPSGEGQECRWRQLDVVYVHWSGELEGLSPYRNMMGRDGQIRKIPRCQCGVSDFRLIKRGTSSTFGASNAPGAKPNEKSIRPTLSH